MNQFLTATAADATAATVVAKAIATEQATAAHGAVAANQTLAIAATNAAKTNADASIDAAKTAANGTVDLVYTFTVASIGVRLVATTVATGFALLRENSGITAVSSAQRSAINAGYTKAIADLAADLAGRNANEALDDPIAIAVAQQSATAGVRDAWQNISNLQARAAETFAGTGPGGWGMTIAAGMGYVNDAFEIAWAYKTGEFQGLAAWADGFIPFFDPFDSLYDPTDSTLQWSQFFGGVSRDALLAAAIPDLGTWLRHPVMYELGSTTMPVRLFESLSHLTPIARGQAIYRQLGWRGCCLSRLATRADWLVTVPTGGTPGGWLGLMGIGHAIEWWID